MKSPHFLSRSFWAVVLNCFVALGICSAATPQLSLVQPAGGAVRVAEGSSVSFITNGTDSSGNMSGVTWYPHEGNFSNQHVGSVGGNGSSATFQKTLTFTNVGTFRVVAQAFDGDGNHSVPSEWTVTVIEFNPVPELSRVQPAKSTSRIVEGTSINFRASAMDYSGNLRGVTWYPHEGANFNQFTEAVGGNGTSATFNHVLTFEKAGTYRVAAQAFDTDSNHSNVMEWTITVIEPISEPELTRAHPNKAARRVMTGESITFSANGRDFDDNLRGVTWYPHEGSPINQFSENVGGNLSSATFEKTLTFDKEGTYRVVAQAFDTEGHHSESVVWTVTVADKRRGMYIDRFHLLLDDPVAVERLLAFSQAQGLDYLVCYDVFKVIRASDREKQRLSDFINRAKNKYGVRRVGTVVSDATGFGYLDAYHEQYSGKFEVISMEYEYWGDGDYTGFHERLVAMREYAERNEGIMTEVYIGQYISSEGVPAEIQAAAIASNVDRLLVHAYRPNPVGAFEHTRPRIELIAHSESPIEVWPLYSVEYTNEEGDGYNFMGNWVADPNNTLHEAEEAFMKDFRAYPEPWTNSLEVTGFHYFTSSLLVDRTAPETVLSVALESRSESSRDISWLAVPGYRYQVQSCESLEEADWVPIGEEYVPTVRGTMTMPFAIDPSSDQLFYRVAWKATE